MTFTVRDYQDLLSLLHAHPEWRDDLRRAIFNEDFLALPQIVRELADAQKRTEEQVRELADAQKRTEEQVRELADAQRRTEEQVRELFAAQKRTEEQMRELAAAQKRTEEQVRELFAAQKRTEEQMRELAAAQKRTEVELSKTRSELANLSSMLGVSLEEEAGNVLATVMRQKGYRVLQEASNLRFNGEVDVILPVEDAQGRQLSVLLEAKTRLSRSDVVKWSRRVRSATWRKALEKAGCHPPYLVYMYAFRVDVSAREALQENGVGLLKAEGEAMAPLEEMS